MIYQYKQIRNTLIDACNKVSDDLNEDVWDLIEQWLEDDKLRDTLKFIKIPQQPKHTLFDVAVALLNEEIYRKEEFRGEL